MDTKCLFILYIVTLSISTWTSCRSLYGDTPQQKVKKYLGQPKIKMRVRILNNFKSGAEATITLIFQSTRETRIRWFKQEPNLPLQGSEVPGYFPIDGDPRYWVEYLRSHDVTSATLHIRNYRRDANEKDSYETIITTEDDRVQYNIRTYIEGEISYLHQYIYSPEWTIFPENVVFQNGGNLEVGCRAIVPFELPPAESDQDQRYLWPPEEFNSYNQLFLNRIMGQLLLDESKDQVLTINRLSDPVKFMNISEKSGDDPTILSGFRSPTKYRHVIYDAKLTSTNASSELEGIYQCVLLRRIRGTEEFEKSFVNSDVMVKGHKSVYLSQNNVKVIRTMAKPCDYDESDDDKLTGDREISVQMKTGQKHCIRCISMGYPKPTIELVYKLRPDFKRRYNINEDYRKVDLVASRILALEYVNVADGGIVETTYVFMNPQSTLHNNVYRCRGRNPDGRSESQFSVKVS